MMIDRDAVDLEPCPFCDDGGPVANQVGDEHPAAGKWAVHCTNYWCGAIVGYFATQAEAIAAWNRHAPLEALSAREATEGGEAVHQCREIGEGDWRDCTKSEYDRLQTDPHHDTRTITRVPEGEPTAQVEAAARALAEDNGKEPDRDIGSGYAEWHRYRSQAVSALRAALRSASIPPSGVAEARAEVIEECAKAVLSHREGQLPGRGWLLDNTASRKALQALSDALALSKEAE